MGKSDSQINVRIEKELAKKAQAAAKRRGKTLSALVRQFLSTLADKGK